MHHFLKDGITNELLNPNHENNMKKLTIEFEIARWWQSLPMILRGLTSFMIISLWDEKGENNDSKQ